MHIANRHPSGTQAEMAAAAASSSGSGGADSNDNLESLTCPSCRCCYTAPLRLACGSHAMCEPCARQWATTAHQIAEAASTSSIDLLGLLDTEARLIAHGRRSEVSRRDRCAFCQGRETEEDALVYCGRCKLCVHQGCYHITTLPEGEWYCEPCTDILDVQSKGRATNGSRRKKGNSSSSSSRNNPHCCVCSNRDDLALKRAAGKPGHYIHLSCASFVTGPEFECVLTASPVSKVDSIPDVWYQQKCMFCRAWGATVQCQYKKCVRCYHVPCGLREGSLFAIKEVKGEDGEESYVYKDSVCPQHRQHVRAVADAHDKKLMRQRAMERKARRKQRNRSTSGPHLVNLPCPCCRINTPVNLALKDLGLRHDVELERRALEWKRAHPEEDEDLEAIIRQYTQSRAHDGDSSDSDAKDDAEEEDEEKEEEEMKHAAAARVNMTSRSKRSERHNACAHVDETSAASSSTSIAAAASSSARVCPVPTATARRGHMRASRTASASSASSTTLSRGVTSPTASSSYSYSSHRSPCLSLATLSPSSLASLPSPTDSQIAMARSSAPDTNTNGLYHATQLHRTQPPAAYTSTNKLVRRRLDPPVALPSSSLSSSRVPILPLMQPSPRSIADVQSPSPSMSSSISATSSRAVTSIPTTLPDRTLSPVTIEIDDDDDDEDGDDDEDEDEDDEMIDANVNDNGATDFLSGGSKRTSYMYSPSSSLFGDRLDAGPKATLPLKRAYSTPAASSSPTVPKLTHAASSSSLPSSQPHSSLPPHSPNRNHSSKALPPPLSSSRSHSITSSSSSTPRSHKRPTSTLLDPVSGSGNVSHSSHDNTGAGRDRSGSLSLDLEIDGLEILDCTINHTPKRRRVDVETTKKDNNGRYKVSSPNRAAPATVVAASSNTHAVSNGITQPRASAASTSVSSPSSSSSLARSRKVTAAPFHSMPAAQPRHANSRCDGRDDIESNGMIIDEARGGVGNNDRDHAVEENEDEEVEDDDDDSDAAEIWARLCSFVSFFQEQSDMHRSQSRAAASASPFSLTSTLRNQLHDLRRVLRQQQSIILHASSSSSQQHHGADSDLSPLPRDRLNRLPDLLHSLDRSLSRRLHGDVPPHTMRRSTRNKDACARHIDAIIANYIDPIIATR